MTDPRLGVQAETITLKVTIFNPAGALRVLDRGFSGFNKLRSGGLGPSATPSLR